MSKIFPLIVVGLMVCASTVYWYDMNWRMGLYWASAALINLVVTI